MILKNEGGLIRKVGVDFEEMGLIRKLKKTYTKSNKTDFRKINHVFLNIQTPINILWIIGPSRYRSMTQIHGIKGQAEAMGDDAVGTCCIGTCIEHVCTVFEIVLMQPTQYISIMGSSDRLLKYQRKLKKSYHLK